VQRELIKEGLNAIRTALENIGKPIAEKIGEGIKQGMIARVESQKIPKVHELVKEIPEVKVEPKEVKPEVKQEIESEESFFKIV
jgi:predicted hydrocarbon binding protein